MNLLSKTFLVAFVLVITGISSYADTVTKTTTVTTIRTNAPIYYGPVQDRELLELTLEDFQGLLASKPMVAMDEYRKYKNELSQPQPNDTKVLYKIKIVDRDLTLADFQGADVSPELAQARYNEYLRMNPVPVDGENVRYVYVYHTPVVF